jgi:hypothetical protein
MPCNKYLREDQLACVRKFVVLDTVQFNKVSNLSSPMHCAVMKDRSYVASDPELTAETYLVPTYIAGRIA